MSNDRFVVTGMGVVAPNGMGREAFWKACRSGQSGVRRIQSFDPSELKVQIAAECLDFNAESLVSKKELTRMGRAVPMALGASLEALDDARIDPANLSLAESRRFGVILGTGGGALDFSEEQYRRYYAGDVRQVSAFSISASTWGTMSSELSIALKLRGPSQVVTSGCTSSTDALGYALMLLRAGRLDRVLVGGADAPIKPGAMAGFALMQVLASRRQDRPAEACRPFDTERDGMVIGEGAWMLVLERAETADARGARCYAELLGYGSTCDAYHRVQTEPSGEESARAMLLALEDARLEPETIDYVALHGTGTEMNDLTETRAVKQALGDRARRIPMSSIKSMIGHPQGACGAASVVATLLAMRDAVVPPTINLETPDPECDLDYVPKAARPAELNHVICNCLAFGSKNSALVFRNLEH